MGEVHVQEDITAIGPSVQSESIQVMPILT